MGAINNSTLTLAGLAAAIVHFPKLWKRIPVKASKSKTAPWFARILCKYVFPVERWRHLVQPKRTLFSDTLAHSKGLCKKKSDNVHVANLANLAGRHAAESDC